MIDIIKKILTFPNGKGITLEELNKFVESYVEKEKGKVPTATELQQIIQMIQRGMFSLEYAAKIHALNYSLQVYEVQDLKNREILKRYVYEL